MTRALIALAGGVTVAQLPALALGLGWAGPCSRIWAVSSGAVPHADVAAVEDVVLRMGALAAAHPEIAELDCNPVIAGPGRHAGGRRPGAYRPAASAPALRSSGPLTAL
jgi:ATP-grasp domain